MNNFEQTFFKKYIPEWQEIIEVFHKHSIKIFDDIILSLGLLVFVPSFLYYNSLLLQENIDFIYFELYLILIYIIIIYKILDWYNDVLILTKSGVTKLEWSLFKSNSSNVDYEHIEWVWVEKNWFLDTLFGKWDLIIHKFWEEEIVLEDASKPYKIVDKIENITSTIVYPEENDKFDLMMDALWWMVQNYLWNTKQKKEDVFQNEIINYNNEIKTNNTSNKRLSKEIQEEFLEQIEKKDGTIDLR